MKGVTGISRWLQTVSRPPCRSSVETDRSPVGDSSSVRYEAEVTAPGYGSRILVDGVELPEVKSFRIEASVDGASLQVDLVAFAKVSGIAAAIRYSGVAFVVLNAAGEPQRVYLNEGDAKDACAAGWRYETLPIEVTL
jgi:hypothetical protein